MKATRGLIYATAAALPLYMLRVHVGTLSFGLLEPLVLLLSVVFAVESLVTGVRPRWPGAYTAPFLVFGAALTVAALSVSDWRVGVAGLRVLWIEPALVLAVTTSVLMTREHLRRVCSALLLGGAALAVAMLVIVVRGAPWNGGPVTLPLTLVDGADGFLLVPLTGLAQALILGGQGERRWLHRLYPAGFLAVDLPAILVGLGRDAWFATAVTALMVGGCFSTRRRVALPLAVAAVCGALLAVPFQPGLAIPTPAAAFTAVSLWGHMGSAAAMWSGGRAPDLLGLEAGLLGLVSVAWLTVRSARWQVAVQRAGRRVERTYAAGGTAMLLAVALRGLVESRGIVDDQALIAAFGAGMLTTAARLTPVRLRSLVRIPGMAADIEPAELPMPADIPRRTGRYAPPTAGAVTDRMAPD